MPRVAEVPFDSDRKRMTTVHKLPAGGAMPSAISGMAAGLDNCPYVAFTKGAADNMLTICDRVFSGGQVRHLTDDDRARIQAANSTMASNGIRVLGVGYHGLPDVPEVQAPGKVERDLVFLGLVGMIDPARPEAKAAVAKCKTAGLSQGQTAKIESSLQRHSWQPCGGDRSRAGAGKRQPRTHHPFR